jgi:hypothetical protein
MIGLERKEKNRSRYHMAKIASRTCPSTYLVYSRFAPALSLAAVDPFQSGATSRQATLVRPSTFCTNGKLRRVGPGGISPRAPHRSGLEPLDLSGSCHPLRAAALRQNRGILLLSVDLCGFNVDGLPASLRGHYSTSSLLPGSPPLSIASVLLPSWVNPLVASPLTSTPRFSCSIRPPPLGSGHLYAGCRSVRKQVSPELCPTIF